MRSGMRAAARSAVCDASAPCSGAGAGALHGFETRSDASARHPSSARGALGALGSPETEFTVRLRGEPCTLNSTAPLTVQMPISSSRPEAVRSAETLRIESLPGTTMLSSTCAHADERLHRQPPVAQHFGGRAPAC